MELIMDTNVCIFDMSMCIRSPKHCRFSLEKLRSLLLFFSLLLVVLESVVSVSEFAMTISMTYRSTEQYRVVPYHMHTDYKEIADTTYLYMYIRHQIVFQPEQQQQNHKHVVSISKLLDVKSHSKMHPLASNQRAYCLSIWYWFEWLSLFGIWSILRLSVAIMNF